MRHLFSARLAAIVVGLCLALGLAEVGLRVVRPKVISDHLPLEYNVKAIDQLAVGDAYVQFDPTLGWVTTPDIERKDDDVVYRNNRQGLRADREYSQTPPPGVRRLAAYGDSYTYCEQGHLEECWTRRLEETLPNTEVPIFGVPGFGPDQAWLRYQQGGAEWKPCAVFIGVAVENINRVVNRFRPFYAPTTGIALAKPRYLLQDGKPVLLPNPADRPELLKDPRWVETNLGPHDAWYFPGTFVPNPLDELEMVSLVRTVAYQRERQETVRWTPSRAERMYRPGGEPLEVMAAVLSGFAAQVRADGATPIVLIFPYNNEILAVKDNKPKPHAPLLDALRQRDVPAIDLADPLGVEARRTPLSRLVGSHFREIGNIVAARHIADQLPRLTAGTCRYEG